MPTSCITCSTPRINTNGVLSFAKMVTFSDEDAIQPEGSEALNDFSDATMAWQPDGFRRRFGRRQRPPADIGQWLVRT